MDEQSGQLTSTRINQLAGESAGHNNETAHNEATFDNPLDVDATEIDVIKYWIMVQEFQTYGIYLEKVRV